MCMCLGWDYVGRNGGRKGDKKRLKEIEGDEETRDMNSERQTHRDMETRLSKRNSPRCMCRSLGHSSI